MSMCTSVSGLLQVHCELFFQCGGYLYHKHIQSGELPPCKALPLPPPRDFSPKAVIWTHWADIRLL